MAEYRRRNWKDVVNEVERAGIQEEYRIKAEEREINRTYTDIIGQQLARSREESIKKSLEKAKERIALEEEVRLEKEKKIMEKRWKRNKELESKEINRNLILQIKASKGPLELVPEHPFIKLVDEEDHRKLQTKKKMKLQNDINDLQTKIKEEQKQSIRNSQKKERELYIDYVDKLYDKRTQDRNIFKQKYLKLNHLEKSRVFHSRTSEREDDVEKDYNSYLSNQIQENNLKKSKKDELEGMIEKINQKNNVLNSSPAFLGRNPMSYDRRKQLEYLKRGIFNKVDHNLDSQLKMDPQVPSSTRKKQYSLAQQVPLLEKYYTNNLKAKQKQPNNIFSSFPMKMMEKDIQTSGSEKYYKIKEKDPQAIKTRINTQPSEPAKEKRKFMTFDIILGQNKAVYI